jgi:signal-transduction protein with cAMP-binding, CBS, and nucleotidyltransferase domain
MTIIEKVFALKKLNPFDRLRDSELLIIAEVAEERRYAPGEIVSSEGKVLQKLYIVIDGQILVVGDATPIPAVFGVESLLFDIPIADMLKASSSEGAVCLSISKRHFFTTIYECPELLLGFLETGEYSSEDFYQSIEQGHPA